MYTFQDNEDVANNLKHQTRGKDLLVLWLDCDREGEAIGFEVCECHSVTSAALSKDCDSWVAIYGHLGQCYQSKFVDAGCA